MDIEKIIIIMKLIFHKEERKYYIYENAAISLYNFFFI